MNTEARIQSECYTWFWNRFPQYRRLLFHIPNGGKRTKIEASRLKAMGVLPGVPDLFLALPLGGYHGMFIEIKKPGQIPDEDKMKHSVHDERQIYQLTLFAEQDYYCVYCDSLERFKFLVLCYIANGKKP